MKRRWTKMEKEKETLKSEELFGMDIQKGMRIVSNNKTIYVKLLHSFSANTLYQELIDSVREGNSDEMRAKVHALKGVTANLSLTNLYEQIIIVEKDIREFNTISMDDEKMIQLGMIYEKTMRSIEQIVNSPDILDCLV